MKEKSACKRFATKNGIALDRIKGSEIQAIYWLERTNQLYIQSAAAEAERLIYEPSMGFLYRMLERIHQHVESSFIQYCLGFPASGEIASRTVIESSVNALYVMQASKPVDRVFEYLSSYIDQERKQNLQWKKVIDEQPIEHQAVHLAALAQKAKYLELAEERITALCQTELSIPYPSPKSWASIRDRFVAVGKEIEYRTTYAAASSQVHSDAEDLLNELLTMFSSDPDSLQTKLKLETSNFSRMIIYQGFHYYLEAILRYCAVLQLEKPIAEIKTAQNWVDHFIVKLLENININVE